MVFGCCLMFGPSTASFFFHNVNDFPFENSENWNRRKRIASVILQ